MFGFLAPVIGAAAGGIGAATAGITSALSAAGGLSAATTAALIGGGASLIGGSMRNSAQLQATGETNEMSAEELAKTRAFNKNEADRAWRRTLYLSDTAHRRQVRDLKKAGLNPILSAKYGGSAAPAISAASSPTTTFHAPQLQDIVTPAVNSGLSAMQGMQQVNVQQQQISKIQQEVSNLKTTQHLTEQETEKVTAGIAKIRMETEKVIMETWKVNKEITKTDYINTYLSVLGDFIKRGKLSDITGTIGDGVDVLYNAAKEYVENYYTNMMDDLNKRINAARGYVQ